MYDANGNWVNEGDPLSGDPSHKYVGRDGRGDVWQLFDGTNVIEWAVRPGDDSRNILPGTIQNLGAPSAMTTAQATTAAPAPAPAPTTTTATPAPTVTAQHIAGDPSHKYVGTDARGDVWQLFDGTNVIEWAVKVNDDSRNVIPGTIRNLGAPSAQTVAQATSTPPPPTTITKTSPAVTGVPGAVNTNPPPTITNTPTSTGPRQSDTRHKYVGRDSRGDVWQIFDGTNVIEWAVRPGDESAAMIPGSARNLGAPSSMTTAQDDGYRVTQPNPTPSAVNSGTSGSVAPTPLTPGKTTPTNTNPPGTTTAAAPAEKSTAVVLIGLAASVLGVLK